MCERENKGRGFVDGLRIKAPSIDGIRVKVPWAPAEGPGFGSAAPNEKLDTVGAREMALQLRALVFPEDLSSGSSTHTVTHRHNSSPRESSSALCRHRIHT